MSTDEAAKKPWWQKITWAKVQVFFVRQFLPMGFALAIIISLSAPLPGKTVFSWKAGSWKIVTTLNMVIIFLIFGLTLQTQEMLHAMSAGKALFLGIATILFFTALTGFITMEIPFQPKEFKIGMSIFACVPTSLSSGVTLVINGDGNGALALLLTVSTNIAGIFTAPALVSMVLGDTSNAKIDTGSLLTKLLLSILLPLVIGKIFRESFKFVREFCTKFRVPLMLFNSFQIILIVWQTLSHSRDVLVKQEIGIIILCIVAALMQHMAFLFLAALLAWVFRVSEKERRAIIVMASQKALPVAAVIIAYLDPAAVGDTGLVTVPCIVFYVGQLFIDAYITNTWASKMEKADKVQASLNEKLAKIGALDIPTEHEAQKLLAPADHHDELDDVMLLPSNNHNHKEESSLLPSGVRSS